MEDQSSQISAEGRPQKLKRAPESLRRAQKAMKVKDLTSRTWAVVASMPPKQEKSTTNLLYLYEEIGADRTVVMSTHFTMKASDGYITNAKADLIRKSIKLHKNVHGTIFFKNKDG